MNAGFYSDDQGQVDSNPAQASKHVDDQDQGPSKDQGHGKDQGPRKAASGGDSPTPNQEVL